MNPVLLKQFLLIENIWIHTSFILDIDLQLLLQNFHLFKLSFQYLQHKHTEEQLIQLISKFLLTKFFMRS